MELFRTMKELAPSGYVFRIVDNGGKSADRYTVIFCDGDYLALSSYPSSQVGVSISGEGIDPASIEEWVRDGECVDLALGDLSRDLQEYIRGRVNEAWRDFLELIARGDAAAVAPTRDQAEPNEGTHTSGGKGIYAAGSGYWVRTDNGDFIGAREDFGPFATPREALAATLPDERALSGAEYHSTVDVNSLSGQRERPRASASWKGSRPMAEFVMNGKDSPAFQALDPFTQGYIEAMFFTDCDPGHDTDEWLAHRENGTNEASLPRDCGFEGLAAETLAKIITDCRQFQADYFGLLLQAYERGM